MGCKAAYSFGRPAWAALLAATLPEISGHAASFDQPSAPPCSGTARSVKKLPSRERPPLNAALLPGLVAMRMDLWPGGGVVCPLQSTREASPCSAAAPSGCRVVRTWQNRAAGAARELAGS